MTDKQFEDALTAAGMWFFLKEYTTIRDWNGTKVDLIEKLYLEGFDRDISGTRTRTNASIRIIDEGRAKEALERIRDSKIVNRKHPEAEKLAADLIAKKG